MRQIVIVADGMADLPMKELNNKTPLEVASKPFLDRMCAEGICGCAQTVPNGMYIGSEVANMSILGYPKEFLNCGRAVLESAALGIELSPDNLYFRCNLTNVESGLMTDHTSGGITDEESKAVIDLLNNHFAGRGVVFHHGDGFKNIAVIENGNEDVLCHAPHDFIGQEISTHISVANSEKSLKTAELINAVALESMEFLNSCYINNDRIQRNKLPINCAWLWSAGKPIDLPKFTILHPHLNSPYLISGVNIIKGIGIYSGFSVVNIPTATGGYDTDYKAKAEAAIKAVEAGADFVFLHVEAMDEASHLGDYNRKIRCIEDFDSRLISVIYGWAKEYNKPLMITILPDHITSCATRRHEEGLVPILRWGKHIVADGVLSFTEQSVLKGSLGVVVSKDIII